MNPQKFQFQIANKQTSAIKLRSKGTHTDGEDSTANTKMKAKIAVPMVNKPSHAVRQPCLCFMDKNDLPMVGVAVTAHTGD